MMKQIIFYPILVLLLAGCAKTPDGTLIFKSPEPGDAFNYPYFLFVPHQAGEGEETYVIVEPNNSGFADDDFQKHVEKAERIASKDFYLGNYAARRLQYPLLVPVFPRSKKDWKIYTHALDRDVMLQKGNRLERLDQQLIAMFADARMALKELNIATHDRFLMTGFSASGTFANRFTALHPERVFALAAGGLNGLLLLPADSLNAEKLNYPVGTGDWEEISGAPAPNECFFRVPQFYFMGQLDANDAVPYDDAFDPEERAQIFRLLGEKMLPDRWNRCMELYKELGVNAAFSTYAEAGHEHPEEIKDDVVQFFRETLSEQAGNKGYEEVKK